MLMSSIKSNHYLLNFSHQALICYRVWPAENNHTTTRYINYFITAKSTLCSTFYETKFA